MSEDDPRKPDEVGRTVKGNLILVGLICGILTGVFLGELCSPLAVVGGAFINLLQMTVLPYIVVAIVLRLGSLHPRQWRRLAATAGLLMVFLWTAGAFLYSVLPAALPEREAGSYFSTAAAESPDAVSLIDQIFPTNPFEALADGVVPAVVFFSVCCGLALSASPSKASFIQLLGSCEDILLKVNGSVLRLMPLGVFAIVAHISGTLSLSDASRIQGYAVLHLVSAVLLIFGLLPVMIVSLTPLTYREVVRHSRAIVITAFATGKVIAVLPLIMETAQRLITETKAADPESVEASEAVVPLAYSFPHLGRLSALLFIPFAAWYSGSALNLDQYPTLMGTGFLSSFGSPLVTIPYLLDAFQLPADMFQLFIASSVICGPFADAVGAMHLLTLALVTPCTLGGRGQRGLARLLLLQSGALLGILLATGLTHALLDRTVPADLSSGPTNAQKSSPLEFRSSTVATHAPKLAADLSQWESRIDRIIDTETLRVGYHPDNVPFSFFNADGELVGFDVDMARLLAEDLGVAVEFVPFQFETLSSQLQRGDFDLGMSGIVMTPTRLLRMSLTEGYLSSTIAFVVRDHRREDFSSARRLAKLERPTIAVVRSDYFTRRIRSYLPTARIIHIDSVREFFTSDVADALMFSAEAGSAWTIEYPSFTVAIPKPDQIQYPLVYAAAPDDSRMSELVSRWLLIRRDSPIWRLSRDYWILGKVPRAESHRWSVIRDVLHWVE